MVMVIEEPAVQAQVTECCLNRFDGHKLTVQQKAAKNRLAKSSQLRPKQQNQLAAIAVSLQIHWKEKSIERFHFKSVQQKVMSYGFPDAKAATKLMILVNTGLNKLSGKNRSG
jgi:hypothetical protein